MDKRAQELIKEIKRIKSENGITYTSIMERLKENNAKDGSPVPSLSTLRRVNRQGSESKSSSFNYEDILVPIHDALVQLSAEPRSDDPFEKELEGYKSVIMVQNEELDRLFEIKEHLDERVTFLIGQIVEKDKIIRDLMKKEDEKEALIKRLLEKCL